MFITCLAAFACLLQLSTGTIFLHPWWSDPLPTHNHIGVHSYLHAGCMKLAQKETIKLISARSAVGWFTDLPSNAMDDRRSGKKLCTPRNSRML
jgi:hypothetical protein